MAGSRPDQNLDHPDSPHRQSWLLSGCLAQSGFTLLEMLLAILLLAAILLGLTATFSLLGRSRQRQEQVSEGHQQLRYAYQILHAAFASATPRLREPGPWPYFVGTDQESRFLSQASLELHNPGGVYHWRLRLGRNEAGQLCLFAEVTKAITWMAAPAEPDTRIIILRDLWECRFTYGFGGREFRDWLGEKQQTLPAWVKLSFGGRGKLPRHWVFPLYVR